MVMTPAKSHKENNHLQLTEEETTHLSSSTAETDETAEIMSQSNTLWTQDDEEQSVLTEATITERDLDTIENTKSGVFLMFIVGSAAIGGLLFGFDTAIISSCLLFIKDDLGHILTPFEKELVTSITSVTALIGSVFAGTFSDKYGRKFVLKWCCVIFIMSALLMGFSQSVVYLVVGRGFTGLAVGGASMVTPVFISEVSASKIRGKLLACNSLSTTGGQLVAYLLANWIKDVHNNWRIAFLVSGLPPLMFLLLVKFIPESPRYSIINGKIVEAEATLAKIYPNASYSQIRDKVMLIQEDSQQALVIQAKSFKEIINSKPSTRNALIIGSILMLSQQCVGFNAFMYYSAVIFQSLGFKDPIFASISVALTNFVFSFVPFLVVDRIGRRKTLLRSSWLLSVALFVAAVMYTDNSEGASLNNVIMLIAIIVYVAAYASGLGTIPWSSVELLPIEARAVGGTVITCCNWSANFVISLSYLTLMETFSAGVTFAMFGVICVVVVIWVYKRYPDVTGIPLERVSNVFDHGVDFEVARELRERAKGKRVPMVV